MSHVGIQRSVDSWLSRSADDLRAPIFVAIAYYATAQVAFYIGTLSDKLFAPFWPPNTVLFCALVLTPPRQWWRYILAVLPAHVIAELSIGMGPLQLLVAFATNCIGAMLTAFAMRLAVDGPAWFDSLRKTTLYILIACLVCPAVAAFAGALVQIAAGRTSGDYWVYWTQWNMSNALANLTFGPIVLIYINERQRFFSTVPIRQRVEGFVLGAALVAVCAVAFEGSTGVMKTGLLPTLLYLPIPLLLLSAIRFGVKGACMAILVVSVVLLWRTLNGPSLFGAGTAEENVFAVQIFLISLSVPVLMLGASIDQTRHAEQATHDSEERMALAAASSDMGLWQLERRTGLIWATDHCREMFGLRPDAPITLESIMRAVHPEERQIALESILPVVTSRELSDSEFRISLPDGDTRWMRVRARAQSDEHDKSDLIAGVFTDVTDRKTMENETATQRRELAHLTRVSMLGELSGGLAHELTQPLTAILSNAQAARMILTNNANAVDQVSQILDDIIDEDNRAGEVIHRLRGLLKKGEAQFELVDLNEIVGSTLRLLRSELISHRTKIDSLPMDQLPAVSGDPVQLQQVLLNLVMNAVDAMSEFSPSRRIVTVRTRATNKGEVEVSVSDHGVGLSHIDQNQLFKPFFTTKERGLGLGLSICSSIIKSHGGTFILENNLDGGAIATFKLPSQNGVTVRHE